MEWLQKARPKQITPDGNWNILLLLAGRGFGKTLTASQDIAFYGLTNPGKRIAVVAATTRDLRIVCFEGDSGLLNVIPKECIEKYKKNDGEIILYNGTLIQGFSAEKPDRLRGVQFNRAWCLVGDTLVTMADGSTKKIKDVKIDDLVITRLGVKKVIDSSMTLKNTIVYSLKTENNNCIIGTGNHLVYVIRKGFIPIKDIEEFDRVIVLHKNNINKITNKFENNIPYLTTEIVVSVELLKDKYDVYDLKVEGQPEFFANNILVHNCDELASWKDPETFTQLMLCLRLGDKSRNIITTTPRPTKIIKELISRDDVHIVKGSTYDNAANLSPNFIESIRKKFEGTRLGRQELHAEILDDNPGALWNRDDIDKYRVDSAPDLVRIVVAIDPAVTNKEDSDESGIIVVGVCNINGTLHGYVLDDVSMKGTPDQWGKVAVKTYHKWKADRIIGETNNGGEMIQNLIKTIDPSVSYKGVHASKGKLTRAEPISALYEQGRVHHVGTFGELEDQLCEWDPLNYKTSPDRLDALVWGLTETMTGNQYTGFIEYYKNLSYYKNL